jgi:hypothetical protein
MKVVLALAMRAANKRKQDVYATLTCGGCTSPPLFAKMRFFTDLAANK